MEKRKFTYLKPAEIKPQGWLRKQLELQAEGLSGHLDLIWPDIRDSRWIGGDREGWEHWREDIADFSGTISFALITFKE